MYLNTLSHAFGAKHSPKRLGRGVGSGLGKTSGRGHKGQKARSGGGVRRGFEGGQMPLIRRLPKFGFVSRKSLCSSEVRLGELEKLADTTVTLQALKDANLVRKNVLFAKVVLSGSVTRSFTVKGLLVTKGAKEAIETAGGSVEG